MPPESTIITRSPEETAALATQHAAAFRGKNILLFGDLGAGKTSFTRALAAALGVSEPVKSPTFVYEKSYQLSDGDLFIHWDFYRLETVSADFAVRLTELFASPATVVVEWPERLQKNQLPRDRVELFFTETGELDVREIAITEYRAYITEQNSV